jgi:lipopolysaccharide transport system ATP-binding protein
MSTVIRIENVSKRYRLGSIGTKTLKGDLERWWYNLRGLPDPTLIVGQENSLLTKSNLVNDEYIWALKDVNFEVKQGEVLGIIGKNGAGKSTLLKLLSRVTAPTTGNIKVKGRIASLLEVGTGFHPDLTGRENIYLNGAILGMTKNEIKSKLDEIVEFAGIVKYIDTPVKRYSSGMYVRLAFAVAAHLEPEILIIDEVLAVGDAEFQKKALGKMQDVSTKEGRTVLFVSHNLAAVQRLCTRSILLENGVKTFEGFTDSVISRYLSDKLLLIGNSNCSEINQKENYVEVLSAYCSDSENNIRDTFNVTEDIYLKFSYKTKQDNLKFIHGLNLYNEQDINIFNSHDTTSEARSVKRMNNETFYAQCIIPQNLLNEGTYSVSLALFSAEPFIIYNHLLGLLRFRIIDLIDGKSARGEYTGGFPGIVRPILKWSFIQKTN